jgi:hypothetical protein
MDTLANNGAEFFGDRLRLCGIATKRKEVGVLVEFGNVKDFLPEVNQLGYESVRNRLHKKWAKLVGWS